MSPGPALPRPLRPGRLSLCCLSLLSQCCLSLLSLCCLSLFSSVCRYCHGYLSSLLPYGGLGSRLFHPGGFRVHLLRPGGSWSRLFRPGGFRVCLPYSGGTQVHLLRPGGFQSCRLGPGGLQSPLLRPGGLQSGLLGPGGSSPLCSALVGSRSVCSALGASVRSALPWWAPVPSSPPWLPHGPGPPSLPLFRLRSTAHLDLCRSVWKPLLGGGAMSRIVAMNIAPLTTRCHSSITGLSHTYRSLLDYISHHSLHPHSCPRSSRLHLFTIIQSHTHYINPGPSATLCRVLFSLATLRSVFLVFLV